MSPNPPPPDAPPPESPSPDAPSVEAPPPGDPPPEAPPARRRAPYASPLAPSAPRASRANAPALALVEVLCGNTNLSPHVERDLDEFEAGVFEGCEVLALVDTRGGSARVVEFVAGGGGARRALAHDLGATLGNDANAKVGEFFGRALATFSGAGLLALGFRGHGDGLSEFAFKDRDRGPFFVPEAPDARRALRWVNPVPALPSRYDPPGPPGDAGKGVIVDSVVSRSFTLSELSGILRDARDAAGPRGVDVLLFDTCLNGAVEIYEELRPCARVFLASAHLMPASGLPYDGLLARLREAAPPVDAAAWASAAVAAFADAYRDFQPGLSWALAAFHTFPSDAASPIARAFALLASALAAAAESWRDWPADVAAGCPSYGRLGAPQVSVEQSVDLLDLGRFFRDHPRSTSELRAAAAGLEQAFAISRLAGTELGRAAPLAGRVGGLSIWVPSGKAWREGLPTSYKALAFNRATGWADCLERSLALAAPPPVATAAAAPAPAAGQLAAAAGQPADGALASRPAVVGPTAAVVAPGSAAGRALVIACDTFGLRGAARDAERVAAALEARGFRVDLCRGEGATRDVILARYDALIAGVAPDEPAVVFFSGHGGRASNPRYRPGAAGAEPESFPFLVPADFAPAGGGPFRGILSYELSLRLARLSERTRNAAVLLDCCHAAQMSREPSLTPKALPEAIFDGLDDALARLPFDRAELARVDALGNPHAVRLVACDAHETAYERVAGDEAGGLFTDALVRALDEAGSADVTWGALAARVRELVGARNAAQHPMAEGPAARALFSLTEPDRAGALTLDMGAGAGDCHLEGGRFVGLAPGDEYAVMPPGSARDDAPRRRAIARVVEVGAFRSRVELDPPSAPDDLDGAPAFPLRTAGSRPTVRLDLDPPWREAFAEALGRSRLLALARPDDAAPATFRVALAGGAFVASGPDGELFAPMPAPTSPPPPAELVAKLERFAAARALRASLGEHGVARDALETEIGLVEGGLARPARPGALFLAGDPIYLRLRNAGDRTLYVHVFDLGTTKKLSLISAFAPLGIRLEPAAEHVLGRHHATGALVGMKLRASDDAPAPTPLPESLVVIAATRQQSLQALASPEGATRGEAPSSPLQSALNAALTGAPPEPIAATPAAESDPHLAFELPFRFARWHLDEPAPPDAPPATTPPATTPLATTPPASDAGPRLTALRLTELTLHDDRERPGDDLRDDDRERPGGDLRIDALAVAPGPEGRPRYETRTLIAPRAALGAAALPLDNATVFESEARGPITLCLWASRHRESVASLAELLEAELEAASTRATSDAAGVAAASPAPPDAALTRAAYAALSRALGPALAACRVSFAPALDSTAGQPPARVTKRANRVTFGLLVEGAGRAPAADASARR